MQSVLGDAYTVEREITGGGMSRLFVAAEHALRRRVVVKVLPRERVSEQSAARFRREIELAAALQHPHILPVHSAAVRDGLLYYVMPYVAGESLRQRLEREGPLPVDDALRLLRELTDALAHAHQHGVIHRDVKPANVLLADGHALLADFGIARALAGTASGGTVTGEGMPVGTPGYMAPEQAAGEPVLDTRADVYALALVGYEMLAGSPPFSGGSLQSLLVAHLTAAPAPLEEIRREVPVRVSRLIAHALAKAPEQRVRSAVEFRDALDAAVAAPAPARSPPTVPAPLEPLGGLLRGARAALRRLRPSAATSSSLVAV
ncbi:MAG TPA: serine/threonine-protein kinase, partial [Gemmatimonadaceae bacterium]|nr:serine/threonine-protein kinase [Gemmatimonadaceae bacterium]